MTLVVCPNLALDRVLAGDSVRPGGTTRCRTLRTQAGGKGSNVVRALRALAGEVTACRPEGDADEASAAGGTPPPLLVGFTGGRGGRIIRELAAAEGIPLVAVACPGESRVSTVVLGIDDLVTRLYELGPEIGPAEEQALVGVVRRRAAAAGEWAVVTGAAPPGAAPGFYAALTKAANDAGYRTLVDAAGVQLAGALEARPELVKVNLEEARSALGVETPVAGRSGADMPDERWPARYDLVAEALTLCRGLVDGGAGGAIITLGAAGAAGLLDGREWQVQTPPVTLVNPVGSGDCFAGALVLALKPDGDAAAALALAAAAGAANATSAFNGHVDPDLVRDLAGRASAGPPGH